ncbi:MAG TPA: DUF1918 domain-containing protein [Acidimicrobiia bacterium]|nr:DUF1918 domain-containing protein [Acidimicrobiia bacterium]
MQATVGDTLVVDSTEVGVPARVGTILEILGDRESQHYRVRWSDGHESVFFPGSSAHAVRQA